MTQTETRPVEHQIALNELKTEVHTPEDQAQLDSWKAEIEQARQQTVDGLGRETTRLVVQPDSSITTGAEHDYAVDHDQETSGASTSGRRV